ncbi:MAG: NAD(+)--rifampin ADP-ribosyltransferase [Burkholderiaceae bacterium]
MNHIYFTALPKGAGLAAEMANGDGRPRFSRRLSSRTDEMAMPSVPRTSRAADPP